MILLIETLSIGQNDDTNAILHFKPDHQTIMVAVSTQKDLELVDSNRAACHRDN